MRTQWINLTPKKAQSLLDNRAANRPLDERYATKLAGAMKDGKWEPNGETLKVNDKGQLEDGQHRCLATVIANCTVRVLIVEGLPSDNGIFETIDVGKKRTAGHMFARAGEKHYKALATTASWMWRYRQGKMNLFDSPRHDELMDVVRKFPELRDSVDACVCARKVMSQGLAGFLHFMFWKSSKNALLASEFFQLLASGDGISKSDPATSGIYQLREMLLDDKRRRSRRHQYVIAALAIKAWNAVRARKVCKQALKWVSDEDFPEVE